MVIGDYVLVIFVFLWCGLRILNYVLKSYVGDKHIMFYVHVLSFVEVLICTSSK